MENKKIGYIILLINHPYESWTIEKPVNPKILNGLVYGDKNEAEEALKKWEDENLHINLEKKLSTDYDTIYDLMDFVNKHHYVYFPSKDPEKLKYGNLDSVENDITFLIDTFNKLYHKSYDISKYESDKEVWTKIMSDEPMAKIKEVYYE